MSLAANWIADQKEIRTIGSLHWGLIWEIVALCFLYPGFEKDMGIARFKTLSDSNTCLAVRMETVKIDYGLKDIRNIVYLNKGKPILTYALDNCD